MKKEQFLINGLQDVTCHLMPGTRHDILHESDEAQRIIIDWIKKKI